ncbi:RsfA family transcriptional regulator [Terrilactibacillus laevilacticus]|uniref:RsfA family transcriptional regulator n=1 Tax=Terrilactibacillus laevilacticus TaxID=1380157 RepID=A0ABW5PTF8_9BACI|nr:RsfA family transcriptional regulator [Terrilactibacillus laevilacticus]
MTKVRQDAWSHEDDLLLAETVLRHIREGGTQLEAFEEVGDQLNRTGAACGFRWNAIVRRKYEQAIAIAKKQRKQMKRAELKQAKTTRKSSGLRHQPEFYTESLDLDVENKSLSTQNTFTDSQVVETESYPVEPTSIQLHDVIHYLQSLDLHGQSSDRLTKENQQLKEENGKLINKIKDLETQIVKLKEKQLTIEEDYQSLIGIMDRARRMVALKDDEDELMGSTFKMDKNGNLEKIAR